MGIELQSYGHYNGLLKPNGHLSQLSLKFVQFCAYNEDVGEYTTVG